MSEQAPQNSPPKAYESVYSQDIIDHGTLYLDDPFSFETAEQAHQRALNTVQEIASGQRSEFLKQTIDTEAELLGVSPADANGEKFLSAHLELMHDISDHFSAQFEKYVSGLPGMVASDIAADPDEAQKLEETMHDRLKSHWFTVRDVYGYSGVKDLSKNMGSNNAAEKEITINSSSVINFMANPNVDEAYIDEKFNIIAQHELIHGLFGAWFDADAMFSGVVSNGLSVGTGEEKHGEWLNEATIEKYRQEKFNTETFSYEAGVLVLNVADAIKPDFEKQRLRAAVTNQGRGEVIGALEDLFGPLATEKIGDLIDDVAGSKDLPVFKENLLSMLSEENRETASKAFDSVAQPLVDRIKAGRN